MNKPKKLIRGKIIDRLKDITEWEEVTDADELNRLYELKIREELEEIKNSNHKDISEFGDLLHAVIAFASENGFGYDELTKAAYDKSVRNGNLGRIALTSLNPDNPSNKIYFETATTTTP